MAETPQRIHILGGPASGKSYLARCLGDSLGLPVCCLDDLFWDNAAATYGVRADPETRDREFRRFIEREHWVVEGVYHQWVDEGFARADAIVVLTPGVLLGLIRGLTAKFLRLLACRMWARYRNSWSVPELADNCGLGILSVVRV